jgi:hypothetical protein
MMDVRGLNEIMASAQRTTYRWEALPTYDVYSDGSDYQKYLAGEPTWDAERKRPWLKTLAERKARGIHRHRVRLLHEQLHDYERYECEWGYAVNGPYGDEVRVLHVGEHPLPDLITDHDYWLIDDTHAVRMHYDPTGAFEGATVEPDLLELYRQARSLAWELAEPFEPWWARHPELHRVNYQKVP